MDMKPRVVVSKCMGFCHCRYDGQTLPDKFVQGLESYVDYIKVCPEVEIGLGVPRESVRLIFENDRLELYQPGSGLIHTEAMDRYSHELFSNLGEVDGFILKGRSPSCGIKDVKAYHGREKGVGSFKTVGRFAQHVFDYFPNSAIEEEGRLTNFSIREHFLTKLYANMKLRDVDAMGKLVEFHSSYKYILLAYNESEMRKLGKIVAEGGKRNIKDVMRDYREHFGKALSKPPRDKSYVNALMHIMGHFSEELTRDEKEFILDSFEKFKSGRVHIGVPVNLLRSYVIKYKKEYLLRQVIWEPFPEELLDIRDTGNK